MMTTTGTLLVSEEKCASLWTLIIYIITATTIGKWRFIKFASVPTSFLKWNCTKDALKQTTPLKRQWKSLHIPGDSVLHNLPTDIKALFEALQQ